MPQVGPRQGNQLLGNTMSWWGWGDQDTNDSKEVGRV